MDTNDNGPLLTPEDKVNMSLDDIIRIEGVKPGISHIWSKRKFPRRFNNNRRGGYFRQRTSQQWRLGRNGPGTPKFRYRAQNRLNSSNVQNIATFLRRKLQHVGPLSVFHRLGWNPTHYAAQRYLHRAKFFNRKMFKPFKYHNSGYDPDRFQKIIAAQQYYNQQKGLQNAEASTLNKVTLKKLGEVLGGFITDVREVVSPEGSLVTTITRQSIPLQPPNFFIPPPIQIREQLNPDIQQAIAMTQRKDIFNKTLSASFEPKCFTSNGPGIDCQFTLHVTQVSTSDRFSSLTSEKMDTTT